MGFDVEATFDHNRGWNLPQQWITDEMRNAPDRLRSLEAAFEAVRHMAFNSALGNLADAAGIHVTLSQQDTGDGHASVQITAEPVFEPVEQPGANTPEPDLTTGVESTPTGPAPTVEPVATDMGNEGLSAPSQESGVPFPNT